MHGQAGRGAAGKGERAEVGDEHGVRPHLLQSREVRPEGGKVGVPREDIDGDVHLFAPFVRVGDALRKFFVGKIIGEGAQGERLPARIYGVRAEMEGAF